jgi:hypothetical protein
VTRYRMNRTSQSPSPLRSRGGGNVRLRTRAGIAAAAIVALAAVVTPAFAAMYKWVDANGRVVYSDQPPPASVKSEVVPPPPPPSNPNAARELEERDLSIKQRDKKRAEEAKLADKTREATQRKREICVTALGQIKALQQKDENIYRYNDKGEKVYYNDEMRREEYERQQQIARENCPG